MSSSSKSSTKRSCNKQFNLFCALLLIFALTSSLLISETLAGKQKGDDIILYNGNLVVRSGKGKGKGGNIVLANSPSSSQMFNPMMDWGMFGRRR